MRARVARIAPEDAIAAVIATQVGQGDKDFAGIRDDAGLEPFLGSAGGREKFGKNFVAAAEQAARCRARQRAACSAAATKFFPNFSRPPALPRKGSSPASSRI